MPPDIRKELKRFAPVLLEAKVNKRNEADTVLRLCKFFEAVLGYDGLEDISREANVKDKFVDVCLKVDGSVRLLVEAKASDVTLRDRHIDQAQGYAARSGLHWVILTNGVDWHLYHLTFEDGEGIEFERAFVVSLASPEQLEEAAQKLAFLHSKSVRKGELDTFWDKATALGADSIGKALFRDGTLKFLRKEIRKATGLLIDTEDLGKSLHEMLSSEAREVIGPMKIRKSRGAQRRSTAPAAPVTAPDRSESS